MQGRYFHIMIDIDSLMMDRIIIAVETAWLKWLARDFCRTFSALIHSISKQHTNEKENMDIEFEGIQCSKFGIWVYKERGTAVSEQFTTLNEMIDLFMENECTLRLIERVESLEDKGKWLSVYMVHPELR